jgi:hypothetical protein
LNKLANFYEKQSLHISFMSRYYEEEGKVVDELADGGRYATYYKEFIQLGQPNQWTLVDLRPMKTSIFYGRKYAMEEHIHGVFEKHDWILLPPAEVEPTRNFKLREE